MTPRSFDRSIVQARLIELHDVLQAVVNAPEVTGQILEEDRFLRSAIERLLALLVEISSDIAAHILSTNFQRTPTGYADTFRQLATVGVIPKDLGHSLASVAGMRNLLTHKYMSINLEIVAQSIEPAKADFTEFRQHIAEWMQHQ